MHIQLRDRPHNGAERESAHCDCLLQAGVIRARKSREYRSLIVTIVDPCPSRDKTYNRLLITSRCAISQTVAMAVVCLRSDSSLGNVTFYDLFVL